MQGFHGKNQSQQESQSFTCKLKYLVTLQYFLDIAIFTVSFQESRFFAFLPTNFSQGEFFIIFGTKKELEGDESHLNHHL